MGQERTYGTVLPGNTAASRRVIVAATSTTSVPTNAPPGFASGASDGYNTTSLGNTALLTSVSSGGSVTLDIYVWSNISEEWHLWKNYTVTGGVNTAEYLSIGMWDGMEVVVSANGSSLTVNAWLVTEPHLETIGAASPSS